MYAAFLLLAPSALLAGCSNLVTTAANDAETQPSVDGVAFGGQQPISGANIYIFSVASSLKGASTSLLSTSVSGVSTDSNGDGYVITNSAGGYTIPSGALNCPSSNTSISTYFVATGGYPATSGTSNSAIILMAAVGPCSNLGSTIHHVVINEVSTVVSVTALQQFMSDYLHVGALTVNPQPGYSALPIITNAMTVVTNLYDLANGSALAAPATGTGISPQAKMDTLGNILAGCVNSTGSSSTGCSSLFAAAKSSAGVQPTNTLNAMLNIAQNPGTNVSTLFNLSSTSAPFMPALTIAPNDYSLAIKYTTPTLTYPGAIATDNYGNVWLTNCPSCNGVTTSSDSVVSFTPAGVFQSTASGYTSNIHKPVGIAIDRYNGIWVTESANSSYGNQVARLNDAISSSPGTQEYSFPISLTGTPTPGGIAIIEDNPSAAWITDSTNGKMSLISYNNNTLATYTTTGLSSPTAVAADGVGNLYVIGSGSSTILEYPIYNAPYQNFSVQTGASATTLSVSAGLSAPVSLAIDGATDLWTVNTSTKGVSEVFGYSGTAVSPSTAGGYTGNVNTATQVVMDGAGTAWIGNCRSSCTGSGSTSADNLVHLTATGTSALSSDGLQDSSLATPTYSVVDMSGNVWVSNATGASVTEFVGVANPVIVELQTASSRHALNGSGNNYLINGGFEQGSTFSSGASGATGLVPGWTFSGSTSSTFDVDTSSPFSGSNKLTFYNGSSYTLTASQTVAVPNGTYIATCYVAGNGGSSTTQAMQVSGYGGSSVQPNPITSPTINYTWQPYSIPNIPVTTGTLTLSLYYNNSGYIGWDSCSVAQQ